MYRMLVFLAAISLSATTANALPNTKSPPNQLGKIDAESDDTATIMTLRLDHKPAFDKVSVEEHGTFLQFAMPGVIAPNPGEFIDTPGPYVAKAALFQPKPDVASVRLFVRKEAADILRASTFDVLDNRIIFRLDHKKYNEIAAAQATVTLTGAKSSPADVVVQNTKVSTDIPEPAKLLQAKSPESASKDGVAIGSAVIDLKSKMVGVAIFCGVMLSILIAMYFAKPIIRRAKRGEDYRAAAQLSIKTIATQSLSTKQKLAVVQVGNQRFLLGLTPGNISLVSEIQTQVAAPAPQRVQVAAPTPQRLLADAAPVVTSGKVIQKQRIVTKKVKATNAQSMIAASTKTTLPDFVASTSTPPTPRINLAIGDEGVTTRHVTSTAKSAAAAGDVTKLIREKLGKLSSLPT